jgi:hypothetical protein
LRKCCDDHLRPPQLGSTGCRPVRMPGMMRVSEPTYQPGDKVEYIAEPVFDLIITTGEIGTVTREVDGWVFAVWPRSGEHSVPLGNVHLARVNGPGSPLTR